MEVIPQGEKASSNNRAASVSAGLWSPGPVILSEDHWNLDRGGKATTGRVDTTQAERKLMPSATVQISTRLKGSTSVIRNLAFLIYGEGARSPRLRYPPRPAGLPSSKDSHESIISLVKKRPSINPPSILVP